MATSWDIIQDKIKEAKSFQKLIHSNVKVGDKFRVHYAIDGIEIHHTFAVEKLYPTYVLISYEASGTKLYNGYAYEDIYYMKRTGELPSEYTDLGEEDDEEILEA